MRVASSALLRGQRPDQRLLRQTADSSQQAAGLLNIYFDSQVEMPLIVSSCIAHEGRESGKYKLR